MRYIKLHSAGCTVKLRLVEDSIMSKALFNDHLYPPRCTGLVLIQYLSKLNPNKNKLSHNENRTLS